MVAHWKLQSNKPISSFFPAHSRKNLKAVLSEEKALIDSHGIKQNSQDANTVAIMLVALLKACAKQKDLHKGSKLHTDIAKSGLLQCNVFIGSALISMYAKCGALDKAQEVFDDLPVRNEVSWNALIAGYAQQGHGEEALNCFEHMQSARFSPNAFTYACVLKACGSLRALDKGQEIHAQIVRERLIEKDIVVASALLDMYIKCGVLEKAQEVFDEVPFRDKVLWTALIAGYAQHGHGEEAIRCFERMQLGGFIPDAVTFACILKACSSLGAYHKGEEIHMQIVRWHLLEKDILICTALVDMYAKCEAFEKAQEVFNELGMRSAILWNALIAGHAQHEQAEDALIFFRRMQLEGFCPTSVSFACALKACGSLGASDKGQEVHVQITREHLMAEDTMVGNAVIYMYAKCGLLKQAEEVFDKLLVRDKASWTAVIAGYAQHGHGEEALDCFERMRMGGFSPDAVTFSCILKACGSIGALHKGEEIHAQIVREQSLKGNIVVANALLDMYAKCGAFGKAQEVFDKLHIRSVVSWNSAIAVYVQREHYKETLHCFEQMQREGFSPDAVTFACMLKACGNAGDAYTGQKLHAEIVTHGLLEKGMVGNALAAMYATCGMLVEVQELFEKFPVRDGALWSALMLGYAQRGKDDIVFSLFDNMIAEGIEPNSVTLTVVLNTCSHKGLLDEGQMFFEIVSKSYDIIPTVDHHTCMVNLFCRACHLEKAVIIIKEMPLFPDLLMWHTLLGACQKWGHVKLGTWAFEHAVELGETDAATYVCMGNICAAAGRQEDAVKIEAMRVNRLAWNEPGPSWCTDKNHSVLSFPVGVDKPLQREDICTKSGCVAHDASGKLNLQDAHRWAQDIDDMKDVLSSDNKNLAIACTHPKEVTYSLSKFCTFLANVNAFIACIGIPHMQNFQLECKQPLLVRVWNSFLHRILVIDKCNFTINRVLMTHETRP